MLLNQIPAVCLTLAESFIFNYIPVDFWNHITSTQGFSDFIINHFETMSCSEYITVCVRLFKLNKVKLSSEMKYYFLSSVL